MTSHCFKCLIGPALALTLAACDSGSTSYVGKACDAGHECPKGLTCKPNALGSAGVCVKTTCAGAADCGAGFVCEDARCLLDLGGVCQTDGECGGGHCATDVCCDTACDGGCERCDLVPGQCTPVTMTETVGCGIDANGAKMCDAVGSCVEPHLVADVNPAQGPAGMVLLANGRMVFSQPTPATGRELWVWDGTTATPLAELEPGLGSGISTWASAPTSLAFAVVEGIGPTYGYQLWTTDGITVRRATDLPAKTGASLLGSTDNWTYVVTGVSGGFGGGTGGSISGKLWRLNHATTESVTSFVAVTFGYYPASMRPPSIRLGDALFFYGDNLMNEAGLWKAEGASSGPLCLWDPAAPQVVIYNGGPLETLNGWVYFVGTDAAHGQELWRTDGTACERVTDIVPGADGTTIWGSASDSQFVYVSALNGGGLWKTDGAITTLVAPGVRLDDNVVELAGWTYFSGTEATTGSELWRVNASSVERVADLNPGPDSSIPNQLLVSGGALFFVADDGAHGREVWRVDGATGSLQMWDLWPGEGGSNPALVGGGAFTYFSASTPEQGRELAYWESAGTSRGILDSCPGTCGNTSGVALSGVDLLFGAVAAPNGDYRLQRVPLASTTVQNLGWLGPGVGPGFSFSTSSEYYFRANASRRPVERFGAAYLFAGTNPVYGAELFATDLTDAGTRVLVDFYPGTVGSAPTELTTVGDKLFFAASGSATAPSGLVVTDGTPSGTVKLIGQPTMSSAWSLTQLGDRLLFIGSDSLHGAEPWVSDGTEAGTFLLRDITPGVGSSIQVEAVFMSTTVEIFATAGDHAFFFAYDPETGTELWRTDGTIAGTTTVADIAPGADSGTDPRARPVALDTNVYFFADDLVLGRGLWRSDGTASGTTLVHVDSSYPADLVATDHRLYFTSTGLTTSELWVSDGTLAGTIAVSPLPGPIEWMTAVGDALFFAASSSVDGSVSLWVSRGTATTTFAVADLDPTAHRDLTSGPVAFRDRVFFCDAAADGIPELYVSDGTTEGTVPACQTGTCMYPTGLWVVDDHLFASMSAGTGNERFVFP